MPRRRALTLSWALALLLALCGVAMWMSRDALREQWHLRRLDTLDATEGRAAVEALGKLGSEASIARLIDRIARDQEKPLERLAEETLPDFDLVRARRRVLLPPGSSVFIPSGETLRDAKGAQSAPWQPAEELQTLLARYGFTLTEWERILSQGLEDPREGHRVTTLLFLRACPSSNLACGQELLQLLNDRSALVYKLALLHLLESKSTDVEPLDVAQASLELPTDRRLGLLRVLNAFSSGSMGLARISNTASPSLVYLPGNGLGTWNSLQALDTRPRDARPLDTGARDERRPWPARCSHHLINEYCELSKRGPAELRGRVLGVLLELHGAELLGDSSIELVDALLLHEDEALSRRAAELLLAVI